MGECLGHQSKHVPVVHQAWSEEIVHVFHKLQCKLTLDIIETGRLKTSTTLKLLKSTTPKKKPRVVLENKTFFTISGKIYTLFLAKWVQKPSSSRTAPKGASSTYQRNTRYSSTFHPAPACTLLHFHTSGMCHAREIPWSTAHCTALQTCRDRGSLPTILSAGDPLWKLFSLWGMARDGLFTKQPTSW